MSKRRNVRNVVPINEFIVPLFLLIASAALALAAIIPFWTHQRFYGSTHASVAHSSDGGFTLEIIHSSTETGVTQVRPGTYSFDGYVCIQSGLLLLQEEQVVCSSTEAQTGCTMLSTGGSNITVADEPNNILYVGGGTNDEIHPKTCVVEAGTPTGAYGVKLTFTKL